MLKRLRDYFLPDPQKPLYFDGLFYKVVTFQEMDKEQLRLYHTVDTKQFKSKFYKIAPYSSRFHAISGTHGKSIRGYHYKHGTIRKGKTIVLDVEKVRAMKEIAALGAPSHLPHRCFGDYRFNNYYGSWESAVDFFEFINSVLNDTKTTKETQRTIRQVFSNYDKEVEKIYIDSILAGYGKRSLSFKR